jgi:hypothetical protein
LVLLWLTRDLFFVPGWQYFFTEKLADEKTRIYVSDTTPAILIIILMFVWPKHNIFKGNITTVMPRLLDNGLKQFHSILHSIPFFRIGKDYEHLIGWKDFIKFPWDVILLGGGSLALAYGFEVGLKFQQNNFNFKTKHFIRFYVISKRNPVYPRGWLAFCRACYPKRGFGPC